MSAVMIYFDADFKSQFKVWRDDINPIFKADFCTGTLNQQFSDDTQRKQRFLSKYS